MKSKFLVLKVEDILKYSKPESRKLFCQVIDEIENGRKKDGKIDNKYLVVNNDEPYAVLVEQLINKDFEINDLMKDNNTQNGYKVYFDGEDNWYATKWPEDKTEEFLGLKSEDISLLEECNLDDMGMWYETEDEKDIELLKNTNKVGDGKIGSLRRNPYVLQRCEKYMPFREVLKNMCEVNKDMLDIHYEPFRIATREGE